VNFEHTFDVPAPRESLWETLMDVEQVTSCIEGVRELEVIDDDHFSGTLGVKMGPVRLSFAGQVTVTSRDRENWRAALLAKANDRKAGGGFSAELVMRLEALGADETRLHITMDTSLTGRIGQMGRPLIKKRVATMLQDFAAALSACPQT
jgi:carbon monoxide dehydrogenase subunit G